MIHSLSIVDIRIDGNTQCRAGMSPDICADYAEAMLNGDKFPPVIVFSDGDHFWLADGFHRLQAAKANEFKEIDCEVFEGSLRDAQLYAVGANAAHGMRRSNADKREAVKRLLTDPEWSQWSDNEIARRCNVSQPMVSKLRPLLITVISEPQKSRTYTTKHGTTATMNTANIGKTTPNFDNDHLSDVSKQMMTFDRETGKPIIEGDVREYREAIRRGQLAQAIIDYCEDLTSFDPERFCNQILPEDREDVGRALAEASAHLTTALSNWRKTYG